MSALAVAPNPGVSLRCPVDSLIAGSTIALLLFGLLMVSSASIEIAERTYGNSLYLAQRHLLYLVIAAGAGGMMLLVPMQVWRRFAPLLVVLGIALLVAVLVPGVGRRVNGALRWIPLGFFNLQGSEFVKLFVVLYLAAFMASEARPTPRALIMPLLMLVTMVTLLLIQPDFGAAVVIVGAAIGMVFLAGTPLRYFVPIVVASAAAVVALVVAQPYRLARLTAFADPWEHQYGGGYQLTQALIAFGRGEWLGLGLGNSIQKLFFLPEAHTDFLYSIIAEELGVPGSVLVLILFAVLVGRAFVVGAKAGRSDMRFHALVAFGIGFLLAIQALINLGVNLGVLPTKGLTLPLMSYGGNSLIVSCMLVGVLLRVEYEFRHAVSLVKAGGRRRGK